MKDHSSASSVHACYGKYINSENIAKYSKNRNTKVKIPLFQSYALYHRIGDYIGKIKLQFAFQHAVRNGAIAVCVRITRLDEHPI